MYYYEVIKITNKLEIETPQKEMVSLAQRLDLDETFVNKNWGCQVDPKYIYKLIESKGYKESNLGDTSWGVFSKPIDSYHAMYVLECYLIRIRNEIGIDYEEIFFGGRINLSFPSETSNSWMDGAVTWDRIESKNGKICVTHASKNSLECVTDVEIEKDARFIDILKDLISTNSRYDSFIDPYISLTALYNDGKNSDNRAKWTCKRGILGTKLKLDDIETPVYVYVEGNSPKRIYTEITPNLRCTPRTKNNLLYPTVSYASNDTNAKELIKRIFEF